MQLIQYFQTVFKRELPSVWLHSYKILSCSKSTGLIQLITNAISIDGLKKSNAYPGTLLGYFERTFGPTNSATFNAAIQEFIKSLAGYSIVCYLLAIKDRFVQRQDVDIYL